MKRTTLWLATVLAGGLATTAALAAPDTACPTCKRPGAPEWRFCPYDGSALVAPAPEPPPPPPAPPAPAAPVPASVPEPAKAAPAPGARQDTAGMSNPLDTIDSLFRAIASGDEATIKRLYRWDEFFDESAPEKLATRRDDYVKRLVARLKPLLPNHDRHPVDIKLTPDRAELKVALRDAQTRSVAATYDFKLRKAEDGWKIVSIRP